MKDLRITTGVAAALLASACGQSADEGDNGWVADRDTAVCVDQQGARVPDDKCPQQRHAVASSFGSPFLWYYLGRSSALPFYGDRVSGGAYAPTAGSTYYHAPGVTAMTRSAAIARGGFGSSARSVAGAHS
jgi:hypothetical protein